jgi:hypothetical protein
MGFWGPQQCLNALQAHDLSMCKPLGIALEGWAAILPVLAGVVFFFGRAMGRWAARPSDPDRIQVRPWRTRFQSLCRAIRPLMDENGRIFREFGPNSGAGGPARVVRYDLGIWNQLIPTIVENNARIRNLIGANIKAIPQRYAHLFHRWINHIDAFEAHAQDPLADYGHHQFPAEVVNIITRNA